MRLVSLRLLAVACALLPAAAMACTAGMYYEKPVGDFKAEMSYGAYRLKPGELVPFHVELYNVSSGSYGPGNPVPFDAVTLTLRDGKTVIATGSTKRADFAEASVELQLPKKNADYAMEISYLKGGSEIANVTLPVRAGRGYLRNLFGGERAKLLAGVTVRRE